MGDVVMGTWGAGPFDNDRASDLLARVADPIRKRKAYRDDEEARAACALIVHAWGHDILGGTDLDLVLGVLTRMRADEEYINGFRDPKEIAAALDAEIRAAKRKAKGPHVALRGLLSEDRARKEPKPRYEWHDGKWIVADTRWKPKRRRKSRTTKAKYKEPKRKLSAWDRCVNRSPEGIRCEVRSSGPGHRGLHRHGKVSWHGSSILSGSEIVITEQPKRTTRGRKK
jgi:hypothetical protein